jgi:hypothetical protein
MPDTPSRTPKSGPHITQHQTRNQPRTLLEGYFLATGRLVRKGDFSWASVTAAAAVFADHNFRTSSSTEAAGSAFLCYRLGIICV